MSEIDWQAVRAEFPALADWTYLNTATYGQLARRTTEAEIAHLHRRNEQACADFLTWFDDLDSIRQSCAQLIDAQAADIAFIPNAAYGLSLLIGGMRWQPGDEILTLTGEFPNNLYYPALLAERGVTLRMVAWEELESAITARTRLVALSTVNYLTGFRPPLAGLGARLRAQGVLLYVDGTQSVGALRFDVDSVAPDVLCVHGYKWLLSPTGAGFLYVRPDVRKWLSPHVIGWRSDRNWRSVQSLNQGAPELSSAAERYEGGMLPFGLLYAMGASMEMMLELGPERIEKRVLALAGQLRSLLADCGGELVVTTGEPSPIVTARFPGTDSTLLAQQLQQRRILASARHGNLRVSVHLYNNEGDLATLQSALLNTVRLKARC